MDNLLLPYVVSWLSFKKYRKLYKKNNLNIKDFHGTIYTHPVPWISALKSKFKESIDGKLVDFECHEEHDIDKFYYTDEVLFVGSNHGEYLNPILDRYPVIEKSNRGRKPKPKPEKKKKIGNGRHLNSTVNFYIPEVFGNDKYVNHKKFDKIYKMKVFRNGVTNTPGIIDWKDYHEKTIVLQKYLSEVFNKKIVYDIQNEEIQLTNMKANLRCSDIFIYTTTLYEILKPMVGDKKDPIKFWELSKDKGSKISLKFRRPSKKKNKIKSTTLKITKTTIAVEGATTIEDGENIVRWINRIILDNYKDVVSDPIINDELSSDSSDDSSDDNSDSKTKIPLSVSNYAYLNSVDINLAVSVLSHAIIKKITNEESYKEHEQNAFNYKYCFADGIEIINNNNKKTSSYANLLNHY